MSTNQGLVKKHKIALFLNKGTKETPEWVRIRKSTAFDLSLNPETQEFDYIADESPTTEIIQYKPALEQSLTMYKGETDYEMIFDYFFELKTGEDAKTQVLIVFYQEQKEHGGKSLFKSWKSSCIISVKNLNSVDSTISFSVLFGGTTEKGYIEIVNKQPKFTEGKMHA